MASIQHMIVKLKNQDKIKLKKYKIRDILVVYF